MPLGDSGPRFHSLADVCEILNISSAQAYALVRTGDLVAMQVGGRGQWRIEASQLEAYIERQHARTREYIAEHPWRGAAAEAEHGSEPID